MAQIKIPLDDGTTTLVDVIKTYRFPVYGEICITKAPKESDTNHLYAVTHKKTGYAIFNVSYAHHSEIMSEQFRRYVHTHLKTVPEEKWRAAVASKPVLN